jgi:hypothetical protein
MTSGRVGASPVGIGEARGYRGTRMSAGHSLRRQNYSFVTTTAPVVVNTEMHLKRVIMAVITAVALDLATFATISSLVR